jgi:hypothetical protein
MNATVLSLAVVNGRALFTFLDPGVRAAEPACCNLR